MVFPAVEDGEGLVLRHPKEPGGGVIGQSLIRPVGQGFDEGVLDHVFSKVEMLNAEGACQNGDELPGFMPKKVVDQL